MLLHLVQQQAAHHEVEIRRIPEVAHLVRGEQHGLFQPAGLAQAFDHPYGHVVMPHGAHGRNLARLLVIGDRLGWLQLDIVLFADLEVDIRVVGALGQLLQQQLEVAAFLGVELFLHVAIVPHGHGRVHHGQAVCRLFMDAALVAHAPWQNARDPVAGNQRALSTAQITVDPDVVNDPPPVLLQPLQVFPARGQPFVRVQHQVPVGVRLCQRCIAGGGKIVGPAALVHLGTMGPGNGHRVVGRPRVQHDHPVHPGGDTVEAAGNAAGLVLDDHGQGNGFHGAILQSGTVGHSGVGGRFPVCGTGAVPARISVMSRHSLR